MTVLPVVVVLLLVWLGVWSQCRVTVDVTEPVLSRPSAPDTPPTGTWTTPRPALTGMSLLQTWSGQLVAADVHQAVVVEAARTGGSVGHRRGHADKSSRSDGEGEGAVLSGHT